MENKYTPPPAYPLQWPDGRDRTPRHKVQRSRFETTMQQARILLGDEIKRLGGRLPVLSSNVELRLDGHPYSGRRPPEDAGVAVYFLYKGQSMCFACDRWHVVEDNVKAIAKTIEALRGIDRWGTGDMLDRAVSAFEALPAPETFDWRSELGIQGAADQRTVQTKWRELAAKNHPDRGGCPDKMARINRARDEANKELTPSTSSELE